jgi:hypothetical protein
MRRALTGPLSFGLSKAIASPEGVGVPQLSAWIFADGTWSDTGFWQDVREWAFAGLFYEGVYWDGGVWDDGEDW